MAVVEEDFKGLLLIFEKICYNELGGDMNGILIIDKKKGITSRDVVNTVVKKFNTKKVGHTGTLDPIATGVLVICVGTATKLVSELTCDNKEYIANVELGTLTDTLDSTGKVLKEEKVYKTKEEIINILNSFKGKYLQEVPIYSAVKINGKKLYEYARNNEIIELPKREVEINYIELLDDIEYENNKILFKFKCSVSKGTYIRSLIRDIATKLDTIGIMTDLRRISIGKFKIEDAINIESLDETKLINVINILDYKKIELTKEKEKEVLNGAIIDNIYNIDEVLFIKDNEAIALYKKYDKDKNKLKPYKMFKGGI